MVLNLSDNNYIGCTLKFIGEKLDVMNNLQNLELILDNAKI